MKICKYSASLAICFLTSAALSVGVAQTVTGSGTSGTVPVFNGTSSVTNSPISVSGSNVGIGTTSPLYSLDVNGVSRIKELQIDNVARLGVSGVNGIGVLDGNNAFAGQMYGITGGGFQFTNIGGSNTLTIANSGYMGIGISNPSYLLDVNGTSHFNSSVGVGAVPNGTPLSVAFNLASSQGSIAQFSSLSNGSFTTIGAAVTAGWNWAAGSQLIESSPSGSGNTVLGSYTGNLVFQVNQRGNNAMTVVQSGNVGIGTTIPGAKLEVSGDVKISGTGSNITFPDTSVQSTAWNGILSGGDYAESVDVDGDRIAYEPGDVLVIDSGADGKFLKSAEPYSTQVSGVYSTRPGVVGRRQKSDKENMRNEVPMAMTGIVPVKVSTENGAIHRGDLLVTSSVLGVAMKGTDRSKMLGAVIGKSIGQLESGVGIIEAVITLQ